MSLFAVKKDIYFFFFSYPTVKVELLMLFLKLSGDTNASIFSPLYSSFKVSNTFSNSPSASSLP